MMSSSGPRATWPGAGGSGIIANFAGLRAANADGSDFVIGEPGDAPGFFNIACFDSPGLSSTPAVARFVASAIAERLNAQENRAFDPCMTRIVPFSEIGESERASRIAHDARWGRIVCRCCEVTEAEIVEALHGPPAGTFARCAQVAHPRHDGPLPCRFLFAGDSENRRARAGHDSQSVSDKRLPGSPMVASSRFDYPPARARRGASATSTVPPAMLHATRPSTLRSLAVGPRGSPQRVLQRSTARARCSSTARHVSAASSNNACTTVSALHRFGVELTGPEYASREADALAASDVEVLRDATVTALDVSRCDLSDPLLVHVVDGCGARAIAARAAVLATGSRERGLGALNVAGFPVPPAYFQQAVRRIS